MKRSKKCSECGGSKIRTATVSAGGGYAPDLLPGAHPWWKGGKLLSAEQINNSGESSDL